MIFVPILLTSSTCCFIINSWLSIWIILEINTLAFCSIINGSSISNKNIAESSINYFVIQSISSSILIISVIITNNSETALLTIILLSTITLMVNIACSPFQQWFTNIVESIEWNASTTLITWQNLAPAYLITFQTNITILPFILITSLIGSLMQMNNNSAIQIIALSSVFNLSWILTSTLINLKTLILFSLIYWNSVILIIIYIKNSNFNTLSSNSNGSTSKIISLMLIINLAGIPPIPGFLANWVVFYESLSININLFISSLLVLSSLNLYIYIRIISNELINSASNEQNNSTNLSYFINNIILMTMILPLILTSL